MSTKSPPSPTDTVTEALQSYAHKGVFRGFSPGQARGSRRTFRIVWHYDRPFECVLDTGRKTLRFPVVLPDVVPGSEMDKAFREYVKKRHSPVLPEHRRIDTSRAEVKPFNRGGNLSLTVSVKDGDYDYAARKLVHLIHEIYLDFLQDGRFYDYMIDTFDLDPDNP